MAANLPLVRTEVRVYLTGDAGALPGLRDAIAGNDGIVTVGLASHLYDLPELNGSVDVILHAAPAGADLDSELALLRERTQAPIVLAVGAGSETAQQALLAPAAEVLLLPQPSEAISFAVRRAAQASPGPARASSPGRVVGLYAAKGGSGKSVIASNLAATLARSGKRTLLVDLDLRFGDLAIMFGLVPAKTLADLAASPGDLDLEKLEGFVVEHKCGVRVLAAPSRPEQGDEVDEKLVRRLLEVARTGYDVVVADTGGAFDATTLAALEGSDERLCVVAADLPGLKDASLALRTLELLGILSDSITFVANRHGAAGGLKRGELATVLDRAPRFELPDDRAVLAAVNRGQPVALARPRARFSRAIKDAAALVGAPNDTRRHGRLS